MNLTARQLALATLDRQLLLERRSLDVAEAVRRLCALQAQAPASPYLALWNRVRDYGPEDRRNGDTLPCLLVDGLVAGVWRAVDGGVELTAFRKLGKAAWDGLAEEAARLRALLADRDPAVYRRYGHWWDKGLPGVESRIVTD
ncbi:winged helix DNA-binding domain-containing protein [Actinacidiphila glaucinigra]|uniref:DNA glycosylase AlkZ-like family protein n=1 Tax=Actinacidiphila glaucinigra TaxID=235986 RepID=UPI00386AB29F